MMGQEIDLMALYPKSKRNVKERGASKTEQDRALARKFEKEFLRKLHSAHPEILASIKQEQKISDGNEAALKKVIAEFLPIFLNHSPSTHFDKAGLEDKLEHDKK